MCEYCDVKPPKEGAKITVGLNPIGKPLFVNHDEYGIYAYAVISREKWKCDPTGTIRWRLNYLKGYAGHTIPINYCPMCGRDLGDESNVVSEL